MLDFQAARYLMEGEIPGQAGNNHPTSIPTGVFATANGHINIAAAGDPIFRRLCKALDDPALADIPDYATGAARSANRDVLNARIEATTRTRDSAEWIDRFNAAGVPCGPINHMDEVFADPQVQHLGMAQPVHHPQLGEIRLVGQAIRLDGATPPLRSATPDMGEHTDAVLADLGYAEDAIADLRAKGAI
jgi:crotonobetainyl-CoA:carnitine CoA-transferase CaiB-like acyl-CoA transferase